jgi:hypothetical protein
MNVPPCDTRPQPLREALRARGHDGAWPSKGLPDQKNIIDYLQVRLWNRLLDETYKDSYH